MAYAEHIIDQIFGGARKAAAALTDEARGKKYAPSTVQSWKDSGLIPAQHQDWVMARGIELGLPIKLSDFFDPETVAKAANGDRPSALQTPPKSEGDEAA